MMRAESTPVSTPMRPELCAGCSVTGAHACEVHSVRGFSCCALQAGWDAGHAASDPQNCDSCGTGCLDYRQRDGKRVCILCVEGELDQERARRREDVLTLDGITAACVKHGYDVEGDLDEASFIEQRLCCAPLERDDAADKETPCRKP